MYGQPPGYGGGGGGPLANVSPMPDGFAGTAAVVAKMREFAVNAYRDERVNRLARQITSAVPSRDFRGEADALLGWMQANFRYTRLPWNPRVALQRLQTPAETLFDAPVRSGECASLTAALAALAMSLGHEVMFQTAGTNPGDPNFAEHVYLMVNIPGQGWVAADPSYANPLGWVHPDVAHTQDWPL